MTELSPRQAAIASGAKTYHGKPCKRCGNTERSIAAGCLACINPRQRAYSKANRDKRRVIEKQWRDENRDRHLAAKRQWDQAWRDSNPDKARQGARERTAKWRAANIEKARESGRAGYRRNREKTYIRIALKRAQVNAKRLGIPFELSPDDIAFSAGMLCPVLGIPLAIGNGKMDDNSPSIDRVENSLGYTPCNVRLISWRANRLKSNATADELRAILAYIDSHLRLHNTSGNSDSNRA